MFSFFNSLAASTNFEKYRLEITAKNYDSPDQVSLRNIVKTFCSEDKQTKSQIAFATILKKLLTSDSKNSWIYILKNLIILDRVVEEGVFSDEIYETTIETIDNFKETDKKYEYLDTERLIKAFYMLIKEKSNVLRGKKHVFCYKRSQRHDYLSALNASETLKEINTIEHFFELTFDLVDILSGKKLVQQRPSQASRIAKGREQFGKSKLLQYIYLQILHKFMLYYSCQLLSNNHFLHLLIKNQKAVKTEQIRKFRKHIIIFKANADRFVQFIESNKTIKGFEDINYKELNPYQREEVLKIIDKLLYEDEKVESETISNIEYRGSAILRVQKKPSGMNSPGNLVPRIKFKDERSIRTLSSSLSSRLVRREQSQAGDDNSPKRFQSNPFTTWTNSYSNEFPQKEVMTVDLITLLKKEAQGQEETQILPDIQREGNLIYYEMRDTNISVNYEVNLKSEQQTRASFRFNNIYSELPISWNQA